jgi:Tol biopolymer transport system component
MLWTIRRDGSGARLLLRARMGGALDPEWSRDGRRVVFAASADRIYEVASTGDGLRLLAVRGHHPRRSPDGKSLAFVASTKNGVAIKIVNRKTARIRTLASNRTAIALASLAWSPDGRWIAYSRSRQEQDPIGGFFDVTDLWCVRVRDGRRHLIRANVNVDGLDWRRN